MNLEVYDIETLSNLFTYIGYSVKEKKYYQYVIHKSRNDFKVLIEHLKRDKLVQIGYNNEKFDYPVIHHLLNHELDYITMDGDQLARRLYQKAQEVIDQDFSAIADRNKHIPQIDLLAIWHFDNVAKATR